MSERRQVGALSAAALVVANMIGAGVFTTSGFALADLQTPERVMLAWLCGGVLAMAGAVCYGALARHIPESAGIPIYLWQRRRMVAATLPLMPPSIVNGRIMS